MLNQLDSVELEACHKRHFFKPLIVAASRDSHQDHIKGIPVAVPTLAGAMIR